MGESAAALGPGPSARAPGRQVEEERRKGRGLAQEASGGAGQRLGAPTMCSQVPFHTHTHHACSGTTVHGHTQHTPTHTHSYTCTSMHATHTKDMCVHTRTRMQLHQVSMEAPTCSHTHSFTYTWTHTCADCAHYYPRHTCTHTYRAVPRQRGLDSGPDTHTAQEASVGKALQPCRYPGRSRHKGREGAKPLEGRGERVCREVEVGPGGTRGGAQRRGRDGAARELGVRGDLSLWQATPDPRTEGDTHSSGKATWDPGTEGDPHSSANHMGLQDRGGGEGDLNL